MPVEPLRSLKRALLATLGVCASILVCPLVLKNTISRLKSVKTTSLVLLKLRKFCANGLYKIAESRRMDILRAYALSFLGTPYKYGGANRLTGLDCSEFVQELLRSVGLDPPGDQSAQALYDHFSQNGDVGKVQAGALAFFGKDARNISHVAMLLDPYRIIEAGGGDGTTTDFEAAKSRGAMVRIRHLKFRKDLVAVIRPRYVTIGLL